MIGSSGFFFGTRWFWDDEVLKTVFYVSHTMLLTNPYLPGAYSGFATMHLPVIYSVEAAIHMPAHATPKLLYCKFKCGIGTGGAKLKYDKIIAEIDVPAAVDAASSVVVESIPILVGGPLL